MKEAFHQLIAVIENRRIRILYFAVFVISLIAFVMDTRFVSGESVTQIRNAYENTVLYSANQRTPAVLLSVILPLAGALIGADYYASDYQKGMTPLLFMRKSRRTYHKQTLLSIMICCFMAVMVPLLLNLLLCMILYPTSGALDNLFSTQTYLLFNEAQSVFGSFYASHPYLAEIGHMALLSMITALMAGIAYAISMNLKISSYLNALPLFGLYIILNAGLGSVGLSQYSLLSYSDPYQVNAGIVWLLLIFVLFAVAIILLYHRGCNTDE